MSSLSVNVFQRLRRFTSQFQPKNGFELIIGYVHALLLELSFQCVLEQQSDVPGFSPTIRGAFVSVHDERLLNTPSTIELSNSEFLPKAWNEDPTSTTILYKHKKKPGNIYAVVFVVMDSSVHISILLHGGESYNVEISLPEFIPDESTIAPGRDFSEVLQNPEALNRKIIELIRQIIPEAVPSDAKPPSVPPAAPLAFPTTIPLPSSSFVRPPPSISPYNSGRSDLDPFGTEVNIPRIAHPPPVGGGNLVGPNHPMFNPTGQDPNYNQDFNPFFPGNVPQPGYPHYQIPRPRFDPFGPVPGPNSDFDFGNEGYDPRFPPRGPRGPPRGQPRPPNNRFYGEPNPDHFKPPGW